MTIPQIVIGANLGDEGKGLTVDYLSSLKPNPAVVRFNGGGQAGHTVETPDGKRHIFSQLGSGSLGTPCAPTYLSQFFIYNPITFMRELKSLRSMIHERPRIFVHESASLTTPFDVLINHVAELHRGDNRHGSCGHGINETVVRNLNGNFCTHVSDLLFPTELYRKLDKIRKEYLPFRFKELGITPLHTLVDAYLEGMLDDYVVACREAIDAITIVRNILPIAGHDLIFEGAQGLMLDENHNWFPHVTRSSTGMTNPLKLLKELAIEEAEIIYVTRSYMTRHGRGPLPFEIPNNKPIYPRIIDKTNIHNPHQEMLRFAPLNIDLTIGAILNDLKQVNIKHSVNLMMTCLDQLHDTMKCVIGGEQKDYNPFYAVLDMDQKINISKLYCSRGPTRATVRVSEDKVEFREPIAV